MLESAARGLASSDNRHDILFAFPGERLAPERGFLATFDQAFAAQKIARDAAAADLPFRGGWFVYLGYELAGEIEPTLRLPQAKADALAAALPVACAVRVPAAVLRDRIDGALTLIAEAGQAHLLDIMEADIAGLTDAAVAPISLAGALIEDAESQAEGFAIAFALCGLVVAIANLLGLALIRPDREAERLAAYRPATHGGAA